MGLANYSELKQTIADYLARPLAGVSNRIDDALRLFEANFNTEEASYQQEAVAQVATVAGTAIYNYPTGARVVSGVYYYGTTERLQPTSLTWMRDNPTSVTGSPERWAPYPGNKLALWPAPDGAYTLDVVYTGDVPALTSGAPTNWLLTRHPNLYLYGALMFLLDYTQDMERANNIKANYAAFRDAYRMQAGRESLPETAVMMPEAGLV